MDTPTTSNTTPTTPTDLGLQLGEVLAYNATVPPTDIAGTRTALFLYRAASKGGTAKRDNSYVRIPQHLTSQVLADSFDKLVPYVRTYLEGIEDGMLKAQFEGGTVKFYTEHMDLDKILAKLERDGMGALSKDKIGKWFADNVAQKLSDLYCAKIGITGGESDSPEQLAKVAQVVGSQRKMFESLAVEDTYIAQATCDTMLATLMKTGTDTGVIGGLLVEKLDAMESKQAVILEGI